MNFFIKSTFKYIKHKEYFIQTSRNFLQLNVQLTVERLLEKHAQNQDLKALRDEMLGIEPKHITPNNVDYTILSLCNNENRRNLAVNYVEYLKQQGEELNLASISKLLKIYGSLQNTNTNQLCAANIEEEIIKIYKNLTTKYKCFDASLTESIIVALSTTSLWKDCLKLFTDLQITTTPTAQTYDTLCITLFKHGEEVTAWKFLQDMVDNEKKPTSTCYQSYISFISEIDDYKLFLQKIEKLFNFWSANDLLIQEEVANNLQQLFSSKFQKKAALSSINIKGNCRQCKLKLPEATLSNEDFKALKTAFFEKVIIGKDVFRKTTPQELVAFNKFIQEKRHYDVIIDGLNVAYSAGVRKPVHITSGHVSKVVKHYAMQGKSVLVLGRNHMKKWPHFQEMRQQAKLFLTQNLSQDDPYLLYCALNSGQGAIIVSRDMMRGHLHLLKDLHLKQMFKRWLSISQHKLVNVQRDDSVVISEPSLYIQSAQKHENVWHLPCLQEDNKKKLANGIQNNEQPVLWLCIQL